MTQNTLVKRLQTFLFYLLIILFPTQLGRHFFFDFSFIQGIRSDYLTPTLFVTDILAIDLVVLCFLEKLKARILRKGSKAHRPILLVVLYGIVFHLFITSVIIASNRYAAVYKSFKIIEFIALGWAIVNIRPRIGRVIQFLSFASLYSSCIAIVQFFAQRSLGGLFWFLGERTFYASTAGIAAYSLGGKLLLRPYATFPHPNVLAGFLAAYLPLLIFIVRFEKNISSYTKLLYFISFIVGTLALFLTFSRTGWVVYLFGIFFGFYLSQQKNKKWLEGKKKLLIFAFYAIILLSIILPFSILNFIKPQTGSLKERTDLLKTAIKIFAQRPIEGVGLNNFITHAQNVIQSASGVYVFQPVHNVFLLVATELGFIGFFIFCTFFLSALFYSLTKNPIIFLALTQLFLLALFDHYLFTLQQGQLLFTLFASLSFVPTILAKREKNK